MEVGNIPLARRRRLRRIGLRLFFTSVACNAAIAIYALLAPDFSSTDGKILMTSLYVTAALVLGLACEPALERGLVAPLPLLASALGAIGFALLIAALWAGDEPPPALLDLAGTVMTLALAGTLVSLLALAHLSHRFEVVRTAAYSLTGLAAAMIQPIIWLERSGGIYPRILGVVLVVLAALVVTIPVLHRLGRTVAVPGQPRPTGLIVSFCPGCGARLPAGTDPTFRCPSCGRDFTVLAGTVRPTHSASLG